MEQLQVIDWIFLAILTISMFIGMVRGLVKEVVSLVSLVLAFILAKDYATDTGEWFDFLLETPLARYALGFALIFFGVLLISALIRWILAKIIQLSALTFMDHLLGAMFGFLRGLVLLLVITFVTEQTPLSRLEGWEKSLGHTVLSPILGRVQDFV
jgi:membrane protein required for colicin V production